MKTRPILTIAIASLTALTPLRAAAPKVLSNAELSERIARLEAEGKKKDARIASLEKKQAGAGGEASEKTQPAEAKPAGGKPSNGGGTKSESVFDRPMSSAAAFTALDVSPETIGRPGSARDFMANAVSGVDKDGKLQTGFALEATPFRFLMGGVSWEDYEQSYMKRLLYNTVLSIATTKSSDGAKEVRLAAGLNLTLWDSSEKQLLTELKAASKSVDEQFPMPPIPGDATPEQIKKIYAEYYKKHGDPNETYLKKRNGIINKKYTGFKLSAAGVPLWSSADGKASSLKSDGWAAFATGAWNYRLPYDNITELELLAHVRYRDGEHVTSASTPTLRAKRDTLYVGAGLRFGDPEKWTAQVEAAYKRVTGGLTGDTDALRIGGGVERRVTENIWFVMQVGSDFGGGKKNEEFYTLGSFRIGSADSPIYADAAKDEKLNPKKDR